jgi:hypothetical protein
MTLPGLKECIELMDEIEGGKMDKPRVAAIDAGAPIIVPDDPRLMDDPIDEIFSLLAGLEARYRKIQAQAERDRDAFRKILEALQ